MSTFGKLLQVEHVLSKQAGLHKVHTFNEAKVGTFDFSSPCRDNEYVTTSHVDSHSLLDYDPWIVLTWHFVAQNLNWKFSSYHIKCFIQPKIQ